MSSILNQKIVLVLNSAFQRVGFKTVRHSIRSMCGSLRGQRAAARALVVDPIGEGRWQWTGETVSWEDWVQLNVRAADERIQTARGQVRAPLIIVSAYYDKMPMVKRGKSKRAVFERDGYRCQYSGQVLPRERLTVDHVIPKHRGGSNDWENLVTCERDLNLRKGHRLNSEIKYKLLRQPFAPRDVPACALILEPRHPAQAQFFRSVAA